MFLFHQLVINFHPQGWKEKKEGRKEKKEGRTEGKKAEEREEKKDRQRIFSSGDSPFKYIS